MGRPTRQGNDRRARRRWRLGAVLTALVPLAVTGCAAAQAAEGTQEAYRWEGPIATGATLEIKGVNGAIIAEGAAGSDVVVTATMRGRRSDPSTVRVERVEHAGGLTFCAVYPTPDGEEENVCAPGDGGRMNTRRNDVEVEFRVEVPRGIEFHGRTVNGTVRAEGLDGDVVARTVNGRVDVSTRGSASVETVNGGIEATVGTAFRNDAVFKTVNGSIVLDLPDGLDADLDVRWLNGGLDSDIPIQVGRMGRGRATGRLGAGGATLRIETVNGSIRIR